MMYFDDYVGIIVVFNVFVEDEIEVYWVDFCLCVVDGIWCWIGVFGLKIVCMCENFFYLVCGM